MIFAQREHISRYRGLSPRFDAALDFLADADFSALPDGRIDLEGDDALFVNLMTYESKAQNPTPEHHKRYVDIQYIVEGREVISVAPLSAMERLSSQPGPDCWLYEGPSTPITVPAGSFMVLWPEDVHAPGVSPTGVPERVRKAVVKLRLDGEGVC